jgi:sodium/hydrogen antiporter
VVNQVIDAGPGWQVIVYAVLALTVVRVVPVALALAGSGVDRIDALFLGWLGPRGLASIVFGMLAFIDLSAPDNVLVAEVMAVTVLLSVVLHGLSSGPIAAAYGRRATKGREARLDDEAHAPALSDG